MSENNKSETPEAGHVHGPGCSHGHDTPQQPLVRAEPKVGRNDTCPCASGKKFKRCCGK
jgi:hypothetical protein